jgi:hypothetical protein
MNIQVADTPVQWLFLDLNAFFASCEQQENPSLRARSELFANPLFRNPKTRTEYERAGGATHGEGTQNVLCAILAGAVLVGLAANTLFGLWYLDPAIALAISALCLSRRAKGMARKGMRLRHLFLTCPL